MDPHFNPEIKPVTGCVTLNNAYVISSTSDSAKPYQVNTQAIYFINSEENYHYAKNRSHYLSGDL